MHVSELLAMHAVQLKTAGTRHAQAAVEDALVDWFGVAIGGSQTSVATALRAGMGPLTGGSRIVGTAERAPAPLAALLNGTAAHALELDDIYAPGTFHPGAPIVSAALAVADDRNATMSELTAAVIVGYEVGCRVARDLGPTHYERWHTTGTAGAIGAAAGAGILLDLEPSRLANALTLAATMAGGLQQTFRSDAAGKPLHSGAAAQAGVIAALAAARGITGAADVLEGAAGLAAATGAHTAWTHSRTAFAGDLAIDNVTVKPYPCCGHTFAPIEAAVDVQCVAGVHPDDVVGIEVRTYQTAITVAGIATPRTPQERRFSIPFTVAQALVAGGIDERAFSQPAVDVNRLLPLITLANAAEFDRRFPDRRGASVIVRTTDRSYECTVDDRPGSPENPLPRNAIDDKFSDTACAILTHRTAEALRRLRGGADVVDELLVG